MPFLIAQRRASSLSYFPIVTRAPRGVGTCIPSRVGRAEIADSCRRQGEDRS